MNFMPFLKKLGSILVVFIKINLRRCIFFLILRKPGLEKEPTRKTEVKILPFTNTLLLVEKFYNTFF